MSFRLLEDRVAIIADPVKDTNDAGLYVPDSGQEPLRYGVVAKVGIGRRSEAGELVPIDVQEGDYVFWSKFSGSELEIEGEKYVFLAPREIVGILEEGSAPLVALRPSEDD